MRTLKNKGEKIFVYTWVNKWWLYFISWSGPKPLESHAYGCQLLALNRWYYLYLPVDLRLFGLHIIFLYAWLIYHLQKCFFNDWLISWELKIMIPTGSSKKKDLHTVHNVCEFYRSNSRPRWYLRIIEAFIAGLVGEECHVAYGHVIPWLCSSRAIFGLEKNIYIYFSCY